MQENKQYCLKQLTEGLMGIIDLFSNKLLIKIHLSF